MNINQLQNKITVIESALTTQTPVNNRFKVNGKYCLAIALYKKLEKYKLRYYHLKALKSYNYQFNDL